MVSLESVRDWHLRIVVDVTRDVFKLDGWVLWVRFIDNLSCFFVKQIVKTIDLVDVLRRLECELRKLLSYVIVVETCMHEKVSL